MAQVKLAKRHDYDTVGIILQYRCGIVRMDAIPTLIEELTTPQGRNFTVCFLGDCSSEVSELPIQP